MKWNENGVWYFTQCVLIDCDKKWHLHHTYHWLVRHVMTWLVMFLINMEFTEKTSKPKLKSHRRNKYCIFLIYLGYLFVYSFHVFFDLCTTSIPQTPEATVYFKSACMSRALKLFHRVTWTQLITKPCYPCPALSIVDDIIKYVDTWTVSTHCDSCLKSLSPWWFGLAALWS